jgi:hypothetical protein
MGVCGVAGVVIVKNYVVRCCSLSGLMVWCIASVASTEGVVPGTSIRGRCPGMSIRGRCPRLRDFALSGRSHIIMYRVAGALSARVPRELRRAKIFGPFRAVHIILILPRVLHWREYRGRCPRLRDFALSGRSVIKEVIILL